MDSTSSRNDKSIEMFEIEVANLMKNSFDDKDWAFPFSSLTLDALRDELLPKSYASNLKAPIQVFLDNYFVTSTVPHTSVINGPFPVRVFETSVQEGGRSNIGLLDKLSLNQDAFQSVSEDEIHIFVVSMTSCRRDLKNLNQKLEMTCQKMYRFGKDFRLTEETNT